MFLCAPSHTDMESSLRQLLRAQEEIQGQLAAVPRIGEQVAALRHTVDCIADKLGCGYAMRSPRPFIPRAVDVSDRLLVAHPGPRSGSSEFRVVIDRTAGKNLGIKWKPVRSRGGSFLAITAETSGGLVQQWNEDHPALAVRPGDRVVEVNGIRDDVDKLRNEFNIYKVLELGVERGQVSSSPRTPARAGSDRAISFAANDSEQSRGRGREVDRATSDDSEQSFSESDDVDDPTQSTLSVKRKKIAQRMRRHETWERAKVPKKRRPVALGFDIFAPSVHADMGSSVEPSLWSYRHSPRHMSKFVLNPRNCNLQSMVMSPSSKMALFWTVCEGLFIFSDFIMIPMIMFDDHGNEGVVVNEGSPWFAISLWQRWASIVFWSIDFPLSFFRGYINKNGEQVCEPRKIAKRYLVHGAPLDFFVLCIEYATFIADGFFESRVSRLLRYCRALKAGKLRRLRGRILARVTYPSVLTKMYMLGHMFGIVLMCHLFGCLWYGVGTWTHAGPKWTSFFQGLDTEYQMDVDNHAFRYFTSLQWSLAQLGFGNSEIHPLNWLESLFTVFFDILCVITMTYVIGLVMTNMISLQDGRREVVERNTQMRNYLQQHDVRFDLRDRIWQVLRNSADGSHRTAEDAVALIRQLPNSLEIELRAEVFVPTLTRHPFFGVYGASGADPRAMYNLISKRAFEVRFVEARQELFCEHEGAKSMWFVVQGAISYRYRHERLEAGANEWIGEAALWLRWRYVGTAAAKTVSDIVELGGDSFREIFHADLPQAKAYAKAFLQCAMKSALLFHDMSPDRDSVTVIAQDVFAPASAFVLQECVPEKRRRLDEWKPAAEDWQENWTSPWTESHSLSRSALLKTMTVEMKRDIIMVFQTMFPQSLADRSYRWQSDAEQEQYQRRILFLKRLFVVLGLCHVSCTDEDNSTQLQPWPYPLASVICHGGRCLLRLQDLQPKTVIDWLMLGDNGSSDLERTGAPGPMYTRLAASHSVRDDVVGNLKEVKLKGVAGVSGRGQNFGLDLPLGGLGNPTPRHPAGNMLVGPAGVPYKINGHDCVHVKDYQHGHLYMRWDEFGTKTMKHLVVPEGTYGDIAANSFPVTPQNVDSQTTFRLFEGSSGLSPGGPRAAQKGAGDESGAGAQETAYVAELAAQVGGRRSGSSRPAMPSGEIERVEDLECCLPAPEEGAQPVRAERLFKYVVDRRELTLSQDATGRVRGLRGVMVHLAIELGGAAGGESVVLVHLGAHVPESSGAASGGATMTPRRTSRDEDQPVRKTTTEGNRATGKTRTNRRLPTWGSVHSSEMSEGSESSITNFVPDRRVVSVLCTYDGQWLPAVLYYVQKSFQLGDVAMEKIYQGLSEEVYLGVSKPAPTINHHHLHACGGTLDVEYDALYLTSKLHFKDASVLEKLWFPPIGSTYHSDDQAFISGLGADPVDESDAQVHEVGIAGIKREWAWVPKSEAECDVRELRPPEAAARLRLESRDVALGSLLFGVERSAPMKEDLFGGTHGASAKSKETSAFGRRKWRDFRRGGRVRGQHPAPARLKVPADLGGVQMAMTRAKFEEVRSVCRKMGLASTNTPRNVRPDSVEEREFFQKLLCADASTAEDLINAYAARESLRHAPTACSLGSQNRAVLPRIFERIRRAGSMGA